MEMKCQILDFQSRVFQTPQASESEASSLKIEEWFDSEQAAKYLKISTKTLLNLVSAGKIPYSKFGRRNRYLRSNLHGLLLSQTRGANHGN